MALAVAQDALSTADVGAIVPDVEMDVPVAGESVDGLAVLVARPNVRVAAALGGLGRNRVVSGSVKTDKVAWYQVPVGAFKEEPTVVVTARHRPGWLPQAKVGQITVDKSQAADTSGGVFREVVKEKVSVPVIGDALGGLAYWMGWSSGFMFAWFWNTISPLISQQLTTVYNGSPQLLYAGSDRPLMKLTTAEVRNVKRDSFQVLGVPGGEFDFVAMGETSVLGGL